MGGECAMTDAEGLHPASASLPVGGPLRRARWRLRLPGTGRSIRVRSLALGLSLAAHAAILGFLLCFGLAAPLPQPPSLINIEFVEIPGPKGGGGSPAQASPGKASASGRSPRAAAAPYLSSPSSLAARPSAGSPQPQAVAPVAEPASSSATPSSLAGGQSAASGGLGGGQGGGQGGGVGTNVGGGSGQGGVAVDRMPTPVQQIKPRYPLAARRRGQSGQVLLRLFVDQEGAVREVAVVRAEPAGLFEAAAVEAVRKWRFAPARAHGTPVGMWMTLPVRFALDQK